jgi:membrane protein
LDWRNFFSMLKQAYDEWNANNVPRLGAALAYFSVFAIAPLLIIALAIGGMVFGEEAAQENLAENLEDTMGAPMASAIQSMLANARGTGQTTVATLSGVVVLLFAAAGVFRQLRAALNVVFQAPEPPSTGIWQTIREQIFSFSMVLGVGFLLIASLLINVILTSMNVTLERYLPGGPILWQFVDFAVSFAVVTTLFALIYKYVPSVEIAWRDIWPGAALTAALFTLGRILLAWYLGRASTTSSYGAAASLVVILLWVYYASQILLYGAAFTRVYAERVGTGVKSVDQSTPKLSERETVASSPIPSPRPIGKT